MEIKITTSQVYSMSYADFVSFIELDNTPPGGSNTINSWINKGNFSKKSKILDIACNNGYSSRFIAKKIEGVKGIGIDLSKKAIDEATKISLKEGLKNLDYQIGNATSLSFKNNIFTHIVAGCSFGFINEKIKAVDECSRVLKKKGFLCVADFFYAKDISNGFLDTIEDVIDFRPSKDWNKKYWNNLYGRNFTKVYTKNNTIPIYTQKQIESVCFHKIFNNTSLNKYSISIKKACYKRFVYTRKILNEHRKFQNYSISIYQK